MGSSVFFPICAIPIILIIMIIFNVKGHIESEETKLYNWLIKTNLLGLILEILCLYACKIYTTHIVISSFILKSYLVYLIIWTAIFAVYIFTISISNIKKIYRKIHVVSLSIIVLIIYILPIDVITKNNFQIHYTEGLSVNFSYFTSFIYIIAILIVMLRNIKNIKNKKYLPVFLFFAIGTIAIIIQKTYPQILLLTYSQTLICLCMFFTIENPDIKMIEELNIARDAADKANKAKSEFLSNMSHEIRTPLNAIVGFSQALSEEDLPESAKEEVKDIMMASNGLLEIVNGILDISKIEANKIEIVNTEYSFKDVYENLLALTKARLGDKPLEVRTSYDESIPKILYGDHTRVKQVILNILTNAVKYTKEGYIDFKVSSLVSGDICRLIISVEDSGIGIKQENISKLFSKFERFDLEKNITIEGTGLGMAITKKLIELMNGTIVVQSVYGKGSKFTIAIDQRIIHKEEEEVIGEVEEVKKEVDVTGKKVLIVDDNKINLKVASRLLESFKLDIETVDSGILCIQKITSGTMYDLILMDDMMPQMSGVETLHKLKENSEFSIPVVALTANAISGMREKYINEGFDDYLAKPIDKEELNKIIIKYLNK